jgi:periplasmic copper chaperone A
MTPRRRRALVLTTVVLAGFLLAGCVGDSDSGTPEIEIRGAVVATPAGTNTAAYFEVVNSGSGRDRLVEVDVEFAGSTELHETRSDQSGFMTMNRLDGVEIPVAGTVIFAPGGLHVMVFDVAPLDEGTSVDLVLVFERSGTITVSATVSSYSDLIG